MTQTKLISALMAGVIASGGAFVTLLTGVSSFDDVPPPAYVVAIITGVLALAHDVRSSDRDPEA
jgi:hypothetical protein